MTTDEKCELIHELISKLSDFFIKEIPNEVMNNSEGTYLMYDTVKEFLYRMGVVMGKNVDDICLDVQLYKMVENKVKDKSLN